MIRQIFIINSAGLLLFLRNYVTDKLEADLISGFLTAMSTFAEEIKGGTIEKLEFMQFQFVYSIDEKSEMKFVLCIDADDIIDEPKERLEIVKQEFLNRYIDKLKDWGGDVSIFRSFKEFSDKHLIIPPKIFLIGPRGAGKTTILDLFPGDTILSLDEDLNEIIKKSIKVEGLGLINQINLWELDFSEILDNLKYYRSMLNAADIVFIITESSGSALGRTLKEYNKFKKVVPKEKITAIIANKQDYHDIAFTPEKIAQNFNDITTYGFSAIEPNATEHIYAIMAEILSKKYIPIEEE